MNRNLITQIKNEWRDNLWLCIELLIVSIAVWLLCLMLFSTIRPTYDEKGFDITDVYRVNINSLDESSPEYITTDDPAAQRSNDIRALIARIRKSPYVEVAALSKNGLPYQFSYLGNKLGFKGLPDSIAYHGNLRMGSPEIVRVLRLKSTDGLTPEQMEEILRKREYLISEAPKGYVWGDKTLKIENAHSFLGRQAYMGDSTVSYKIGGIIESVKRNEYESKMGTIIMPRLEDSDFDMNEISEIAIRVLPGMGKKFEEEFYANPDMRRMRNIYLTELSDMKKVRAANQRTSDTEVRLTLAGVFFLLLIIFLGLLGTFWFRIRQRTGEIALRKTCGATSSEIFRRIISEGLLLLLFVSIPALIADGFLTFYLLRDYSYSMADRSFSWIPAIIAYGIATAVMIIMIIAGVYFPARKAMEIEPAIALKEE